MTASMCTDNAILHTCPLNESWFKILYVINGSLILAFSTLTSRKMSPLHSLAFEKNTSEKQSIPYRPPPNRQYQFQSRRTT